MSSSRHWIAIVAVLAVMVGCSSHEIDIDNQSDPDVDAGTDTGPQTDTDEPEPDADNGDDGTHSLEEFEQASVTVVAAECERLLNCCNDDELTEQFMGNPDIDNLEDCIQANTGMFGHGEGALSQMEQEGRIAFDPTQADVCLESIGALDCEEFAATDRQRQQLPGCRTIIQPLVETGDNCEYNFECKTGICDREDQDSEPVCRSPIEEEGAECRARICGSGLYCDLGNATCEAQKPEGEGCLDDEECETEFCGDAEDADHNACRIRSRVYCTGD